MMAARSHPLLLAVENALYTPTFFLLLLLCLLLTGAWLGGLIALVGAGIASVAYQLLINRLNDVPARAAVIVTGCSSGFGLESAIRLSKLGFLVFASVRSEPDLQLLQSHAIPNLVPLLLHVASNDSRQSALTTVTSHLTRTGHRLLGCVWNAGWALSSPLELMPLYTVRREYEANVFSIIHLTQLFLPLLRQSNYPPHTARVVITSSSLGMATMAGGAVYSSTKHAVEALGDGFRMELTPWAIDVVLVEPGSHSTPFHPKADATQQESLDRARKEAAPRCGPDVLARYERAGREGYSPPPSDAMQPVGVVIDAIVTGLLAKYAPARIKCGADSAMGGVLGLCPSFISDKVMGKGFV